MHRILIVEDESIVALDLQTRLEAHGFEVVDIVSTGSRAIERAREESPDLILMDINLKGSIDGVETASLIRRFSESPILFLTAYADEKTVKRARISDASGYILKPFRESELFVTIELTIKRSSIRKKIQDNSNWLYSTLNNMADAVITVSEEKRIVFMNASARGLLDNEFSLGDIFDEDNFILKENGKLFFRKEGKNLDIEHSSTEIFDEEGIRLGFAHHIHDISRQVAYEEGLEKARVAAENSNRAKGDFLANVTHELRTPLNTIIGMNSLMSELNEDKEISEMRDLIGKAAESLLSMVNELLDLSELDNGETRITNTRFSVSALVDDVIGTFRSQAELKSLSIRSEIEDIPVLTGDRSKIREITSCLMSNAVKFTRRGSVTIKGRLDGNNLVLDFIDTGIGMTEEQKGIIFEQFTQIDSSRTRYFGGVGVGLTLVSKIIGLLNGSISVESRELEGSTFTVSIPVKPSKDQKSEPETFDDESRKGQISKSGIESLRTLAREILRNFEAEDFEKCQELISRYIKDGDSLKLDYDSQILFSLSAAVKLKNREKLDRVIGELTE